MVRKYKKSLGQNFLRDDVMLDKISSSINLSSCKKIIEIGPGDGALTRNLLAHNLPVTVVEYDRDLIPKLQGKFSEFHNFSILNEDILKVDLQHLSDKNSVIVGNLPYNISSQIILKLLESRVEYRSATFLIQKELAQRFCTSSKKSTKISLLAHFFTDIELLFDVSPDAFVPQPKVTSTLIRVSPHQRNIERLEQYLELKKILESCFANPRKQIKKSLTQLGIRSEKLSFESSSRPDDLALQDYFEILDISEK
ncbi:MAG: 16S rRNA (adenine(1518)-N(6)/adenine(1519)-N(6))-dimethyltransferase RsmA [Proteobacteria bacterium]|nr:16S rRNA (adenine(1518)-N(6)/adenine(1519)-N(6))-dimethyltransferase RsmA [Pseudomonadota bacterium]MDA0899787.1 16S rRNA (adenine(1518)-N(6)/adenine(1519)-N(6))-dimethyltransferase RsmA [Pseudomonadota bacterium]